MRHPTICLDYALDGASDDTDMVRPDSAPDPDEAPWARFDGPEDGCAFFEPAHARRQHRERARAARYGDW